jgi:xanthine/uracil permease
MAKRPENLIYARAEQPPLRHVLPLGFQHAALAMVYLINAVVIARAAGFSHDQLELMLSASLLCCGLGAILQGGFPRISGGLLIIPIASPILIAPLSEAGLLGGAGAIAALVIMGGLIQMIMAPIIFRMRAFFTSEVCGVAVLMLGVSLIRPAGNRFTGITGEFGNAPIDATHFAIATLTLTTIVVSAGWLKGTWRFFSMLLGCIVGYTAAAALGGAAEISTAVASASNLYYPRLVLPSWPDPAIIPVVVLFSMMSGVYSMGVILNTDRLDDAEWSKPELRQVSRGVAVMGFSNVLSGILGGSYLGMSSTSTALAFATGVTSRLVGVAAGIVLIAFSFSSKLMAAVMAMPDPVLGGVLAFIASYLIVSGAQLALTRMLSPRRMIVIGIPICLGIAVVAVPGLTAGLTGSAAAIANSPYIVAAILVLILNAAARIGVTQTTSRTFLPEDNWNEQVSQLLNHVSGAWGLQQKSVLSVKTVLLEVEDLILTSSDGPIEVIASYDELKLNFKFIYSGSPIVFPDKMPTAEQLLEEPDGVRRMSAWLVRGLSSRCTSFKIAGREGLALRFDC